MKRRLTAILTAVLCMSAPLTAAAADIDADSNAAVTISTDTFSYTSNNRYSYQNGFFLESELADPDFMVVGVSYVKDTDEVFGYIVTPINDVMNGLGTIQIEIITRELGDQQLQVGDLLKVDGVVLAADIYPTYYLPEEEGTMSFIGNGVDIFGEEFERVIRLQLVIDQEAYENAHARIYDIDLLRGDVNVDDSINVLDCISINKNLLAGAPLCDYAKIAGDINENSMIDADDSLCILKEIVGLTENFE